MGCGAALARGWAAWLRGDRWGSVRRGRWRRGRVGWTVGAAGRAVTLPSLSAGPAEGREPVCAGPPGKARAPEQLAGFGKIRPSLARVCAPPSCGLSRGKVTRGGGRRLGGQVLHPPGATYGVSGSAALPAQVRWHGLGSPTWSCPGGESEVEVSWQLSSRAALTRLGSSL